MLNEDRVLQMTRMAMMHKHEDRDLKIAENYRGRDYAAVCRLRTWIFWTILYIAALAGISAAVLYRVSTGVTTSFLMRFLFGALIVYLCAMFILLLLTGHAAARRYDRARKKLAAWDRDVKELSRMYAAEDHTAGETSGKAEDE